MTYRNFVNALEVRYENTYKINNNTVSLIFDVHNAYTVTKFILLTILEL